MIRAFILFAALALTLAGCAPSKFKDYRGPAVTEVRVFKQARQMYLLHGEEVLSSHDVGLGFAPIGHKQFEGDGRTPEGSYLITKRNPDSKYHLSIGIDYPRPADVARAQSMGLSPGGDIFIHGEDRLLTNPFRDWTAGCIAVSNEEIELIYAMVRDGTPINIYR